MFSNDKNVETITSLIEKFKHYLELQSEFVKLDVAEKIVRLITVFSLIAITVIASVVILFFISFAVAYALSTVMNTAWAFCIVAAFYLVLFLIIISNRKKFIERPLVKLLSAILLNK